MSLLSDLPTTTRALLPQTSGVSVGGTQRWLHKGQPRHSRRWSHSGRVSVSGTLPCTTGRLCRGAVRTASGNQHNPGQALLVERRSASHWPGGLEKVPTLTAPNSSSVPHSDSHGTNPRVVGRASRGHSSHLGSSGGHNIGTTTHHEGEPSSWRGSVAHPRSHPGGAAERCRIRDPPRSSLSCKAAR